MNASNALRLGDYLDHIQQAILRIDQYTADMVEMVFLNDSKTQDAVIRNFEVIGEACRNIIREYPEFASQHPEVPWSFAYEMRNALAHGYFKVDMEIVWKTIHGELPNLFQQIKKIIESLSPR